MYDDSIRTTICDQIAEGLSLREVCRQDGFPSLSTVMRWLSEDTLFQEQYARAKEIGIEALAEDILDIADNGENDYMKRSGKDQEPGYVVNGEAIQRSRLRVDSRKWLLSKLAPKKYGDKIETTLQGPNGGAIEVVGRIERAIIKPSENTKA